MMESFPNHPSEKTEEIRREEEKLIPPNPRLRYIEKTLALLNPGEDENGNETSWLRLSEKVAPWKNGMELAENIRAAVREYVAGKIPDLKEKIPSIKDLPENELLDALSNGWFEGVQEQIDGKRKEILLSVLSHITKKIETRAYKQIIKNASPEALETLGLNENLRTLASECLDTSAKADPLFVRYLAYAQFAPDAPEDAEPTNPIGPDEKPHSFAELFPKETSYISEHLASIAERKEAWKNEPGAAEFQAYLTALSSYIGEKDPEKTAALRLPALDAFNRLIQTEFPINIISPIGGYDNVEGYYKPPYLDPELRVVIRSKDSKEQEERFTDIRKSLASKLGTLGLERFADQMTAPPVRNYIAVGSYGVNATFVAAAQSDPAIMMFLDEQSRAYDKNLKEMLSLIDGTEDAFRGVPDQSIEEMSRTDTELHEFSHSVYPGESDESKRLGSDQQMIAGEFVAESIHRALSGELIEEGALPYTKDQFIRMSIAMALQSIKGNSPDDEYFKADTFVLDGLFEKGLTDWNGEKIIIKDADGVFEHYRENAKTLISLYEDKEMDPEKADKWIKKYSAPGAKMQALIDRLNPKEAE